MDALDVHLYGTRIGELRRHGTGVEFVASEDAIRTYQRNSRILSTSLPLSPQPQDATPFVGGLLPEGSALDNLRRLVPREDQDVFGLIRFVGRDVAGAVAFGPPTSAEQRYVELTESQVAERLDAAASLPFGNLTGGSSLSGFQRKITLAHIDNRWCAREGGAASTHILKPVATENEPVLHAEDYALALARHVGLLAYASHVTHFDGRPTLVIERYDRVVTASGTVERIHQEDSAQGLGLAWDDEFAKFEGVGGSVSLRRIGGLLPPIRVVTDRRDADREKLLQYVTFNVAIGNTDAHAKNFSFLHLRDGSIALAPMYDVAPHAFAFEGRKTLALWVDAVQLNSEITTANLVDEAAGWGLDAARAAEVIELTLLRLERAVLDVEAHPSIGATIPGWVLGQVYNLLDGKKAATPTAVPWSLSSTIDLPKRPAGIPPATTA
jgi:serine/threonine-protein kinase HipA